MTAAAAPVVSASAPSKWKRPARDFRYPLHTRASPLKPAWRLPFRANPQLGLANLEVQGKFARLQRHYLSYCRLVWNVLMYQSSPPKRVAPKRRGGRVRAKMAQAAGGSKCGRGGA